MRHENGNCMPAGGFCTAVNDPICEALHNAFKHGKSAEYERLTLACVKENAKYEQETLEALREIYKKVTTPTVEVVRCKDCDNTCPGSNGLVCTAWGARTDPDGWCYKAERKTDGKSL